MAIGDWMKSEALVTNAAHALAGACVLLVAALFTHARMPLSIVEVVLAAYVLIKEYYIDLYYESGEDVASSTADALGYVAGNLLAVGLLVFARHLGSW
jgi:hypothetical protein